MGKYSRFGNILLGIYALPESYLEHKRVKEDQEKHIPQPREFDKNGAAATAVAYGGYTLAKTWNEQNRIENYSLLDGYSPGPKEGPMSFPWQALRELSIQKRCDRREQRAFVTPQEYYAP